MGILKPSIINLKDNFTQNMKNIENGDIKEDKNIMKKKKNQENNWLRMDVYIIVQDQKE